jgi:hypothetical protein
MPLIEAALAFAITMLALSLVVSSFVEVIHRIFSMREAGLKYMLGQMFDQVLSKHLKLEHLQKLVDTSKLPEAAKANTAELLKIVRAGFVERMSANRAPMGVPPKATPTHTAEQVADNPKRFLGLWNGRDLAAMTPTEFMERLGSIDVGEEIKNAATAGEKAATDALDSVLKGIAQKFEAFGKEAGAYFEGRARLLSVIVAIGLAVAAHVDAVDLFRVYLRDPNARAKVIEQSAGVTAQHTAALEAAKALKLIDPEATLAPEEVKKQIETLKNDWKAAISNANSTVKQYADLGVPLGWSDERIKAADMSQWVWLCPAPAPDGWQRPWGDCKREQRNVWIQVPTVLSVWFYLFLGGLLIGLGAPFWYRAVTGLTNIRNVARGAAGEEVQSRAAVAAVEAGKAQPVTPVGAFQVSHAARRG